MCMMCEGISWRQVQEQNRKAIARHGFTTIFVEGSTASPPFGYTMGLTAIRNSELLVTGLDAGRARALLCGCATLVLSGQESFVPGLTLFGDVFSVYSLEVVQPESILICAYELYGRRMSAVQLVWADDQGRFPWAPNVNQAFPQPLLGTLPPM